MIPIAIVQARMGSTRLPEKVLLPLAGKPVLGHVIERLGFCSTLDGVVVATTVEDGDDAVVEFCESLDIPVFRGSEDDVLDRYHRAAAEFKADPVVRITADCPAIDPAVVDAVVDGFRDGEYDMYGLTGEFPDGLDCTVFSAAALEKAWREARLASEREHVGPYIQNHPDLFRVGGLELFFGLGGERWTLDEPEDYELLSRVFDRLYKPRDPFTTADVLALLDGEPELRAINQNVTRNEGYLRSLEEDRMIE